MARRRVSQLKVDMFPFLSVLCSVIGVLMLFMMIIISTRVIEAEEQNPVSSRNATDVEEGAEDGIKSDDYKRLEKQIETSEKLLAQRTGEHAALRAKVRLLRNLLREKKRQIAKRNTPPQPAQRIGQPKKVQPVPDAKYRIPGGLTPVFLEIKSEGYHLQPDDVWYSPVKKEGRSYQADEKLAAFLRTMESQRGSKYLILLIHPSGVTAYRNLRGYLRTRRSRINVGTEPFSSDWKFIREKKNP